jgi:acylphosphatase
MNWRTHVFIHGDVIGVGFRAWTVRNAKELGLKGWVRNADYRTVEAVFEGEKEKVEEMIKHCHKGPKVCWVERVEVNWEKGTYKFFDFNIIY